MDSHAFWSCRVPSHPNRLMHTPSFDIPTSKYHPALPYTYTYTVHTYTHTYTFHSILAVRCTRSRLPSPLSLSGGANVIGFAEHNTVCSEAYPSASTLPFQTWNPGTRLSIVPRYCTSYSTVNIEAATISPSPIHPPSPPPRLLSTLGLLLSLGSLELPTNPGLPYLTLSTSTQV